MKHYTFSVAPSAIDEKLKTYFSVAKTFSLSAVAETTVSESSQCQMQSVSFCENKVSNFSQDF